jgi:hypothetical protein
VVEHEVRDCGVEGLGLERKRLSIADPRIHPARDRQLNHSRRLIERDDVNPFLQKPLSELAAATANLDHSPRPSSGDPIESDLLRLRPCPTSPQRDPVQEARLVGVLTANGLRVVLLTRDAALII